MPTKPKRLQFLENADNESSAPQDGISSSSTDTPLDEGRSTRATTPPSASGSEIGRRGAYTHTPEGIPPELLISNERRQVILGTAQNTPSSDVAVRHTMHFTIRVLKSWPRLMAAHLTEQLPPPIHRLQIAEGIPTPLANCYALAKLWAGHTDGSRELVKKTILHEIRRLLSEVRQKRKDKINNRATTADLI